MKKLRVVLYKRCAKTAGRNLKSPPLSLHPQPEVNDNKIPEVERPVRPTVNELEIVRESNDIPLRRNIEDAGEEYPSNVLMAHASDESIFNKTEVLAGQYRSSVVELCCSNSGRTRFKPELK